MPWSSGSFCALAGTGCPLGEQAVPTEIVAASSHSDLEKVLAHYGCTFDDVVAENVYTTNMAAFLKASAYRSTIYKKQFPTGTWLEVKGLALPGFMIEIGLEAHKAWDAGQ